MPKPWLSKLDLLQVKAFKSVYCQNLRLGDTKEQAFATAIVMTCDEVFKETDPELIKEYFKRYGKRKAVQRIENQPAYVGG